MIEWLGAQQDDALDGVLCRMVEAHVGLPCPVIAEVQLWTGMSRRRVWKYLYDMAARGLIEIETSETRTSGRDPKRRRMHLPGGLWTAWTNRSHD